jgi:hypothetical protein
MSPIEFLRAAYRLRATHAPLLAVTFVLGAILTYHALVDTSFEWLLQ